MLQLIAQALPTPDTLASFGTAGLMGAMWLWERRTSTQREQQLDATHARILADRVELDALMSLVRQNTETLSRLVTLHEQTLIRVRGSAVATPPRA